MPTFLVMILTLGTLARAEVPSALEPQYAEAVLSYNEKDYAKTVSALNALIAQEPGVFEFLELKALTLKAMKDPHAIDAYGSLIKLKTAAKGAPKELATYHFELGQLYFDKGDYAHARESLTYAMKMGVNVYPSHYFLALIHFKSGEWEQAEAEFRQVLRGDVDDLKPSAHFYIGEIALQTGYAPGATKSFFAARTQAKAELDSTETVPETRKMAQQVYDQADAGLKPFSSSKWFGNATLLTGYDSNVLSVPSSQVSTGTGTGIRSVKETLQAGLGYMTSPLNTVQWVPSYKGSFNYNFNENVRDGQFISHDVSLYATKGALDATSWGLKLEGVFVFQDQVDPATNKGTFKPYSLVGSVGPYYRTEIARKTLLGGEIDVQPGRNYLDPSVPDAFKRSGIEYLAKFYLKKDSGNRWWNPGASVGFDVNSTTGSEYESKGLTFGVADALHLGDSTNVNLSVDFSPVSFAQRLGDPRYDKMVALDANLSQKLTEKCSLVGDVQYIDNLSNITDVYQYTRLVVSAGLGYSL
jgi:hypothetical protein